MGNKQAKKGFGFKEVLLGGAVIAGAAVLVKKIVSACKKTEEVEDEVLELEEVEDEETDSEEE